jgi:hypothetical protein
MFRGDCTVESRENVLSGNSVTCSAVRSKAVKRWGALTSFIKYDRQKLLGMLEQTKQDAHFRDSVIGTTCRI